MMQNVGRAWNAAELSKKHGGKADGRPNRNKARARLPSCVTSCSNESSKIKTFPSCHALVSSPTLILAPSQPMMPRCTRSFLFVGPLWGMMWVPGVIAENMECL